MKIKGKPVITLTKPGEALTWVYHRILTDEELVKAKSDFSEYVGGGLVIAVPNRDYTNMKEALTINDLIQTMSVRNAAMVMSLEYRRALYVIEKYNLETRWDKAQARREEEEALEAAAWDEYLSKGYIKVSNLAVNPETTDVKRWLKSKCEFIDAPRNQLPSGHITVAALGNNRYYLNRLIWESVNGKLEKGELILFKDGDVTNCHISNLQKSTRSALSKMNNFGRGGE